VTPPEWPVLLHLRPHEAEPPGFTRITPWFAAALPAEASARLEWSDQRAIPRGWRIVDDSERWRRRLLIIAPEPSWLFWRCLYGARRLLHRLAYPLGWAILKAGCWMARVDFDAASSGRTLAGAWEEAARGKG
jgi:hypothetical protein